MFRFPKIGLRRRASEASSVAGNAERSLTLNLNLSDIACAIEITGTKDAFPAKIIRVCAAREQAEFCAPLSRALTEIPENVKSRIGNVVVYFDDPDLSLVDSRQANIDNFDKRTLSHFAHSHISDGAVAVASHPYGKPTSLESERRLIASMPEARLKLLLSALGKLAPYLTVCAPTVTRALTTDENSDVQATLYVHGYFSSLVIANGATGVVAVRHLPFGTLTLARAYGDDLGLPLEDACAALERRARLESPDKLLAEVDLPLAHTGTALALLPLLRQVKQDVLTTIEYFSSNRLSGHPFRLDAFVSGFPVEGLGQWLSELLEMEVQCRQETVIRQESETTLQINLLEATSSELLKIGNQSFEFVSGKFVPINGAMPGKRATALRAEPQDWRQRISEVVSSPIGFSQLKILIVPVGALSMCAAAIMTVNWTIVQPASDALDAKIQSYQIALAQKDRMERETNLAREDFVEPALWAEDILAIADALSSEAQLTSIALTPALGEQGGQGTLLLSGHLPEIKTGNLRLIGQFISDISNDAKLSRRLSDVQFTGATESDEQTGLGVVFEVSAVANIGLLP